MTSAPSPREPIYRAAITAGRMLLKALDVTVRSTGQEHVPTSGAVVLACNHVSFPDFVFVQQALLGNRLVRFMCRADIWDVRLPGKPVARGMDAMGHIPVDRQTAAAAYLKARRLLGEGEILCVFPEGGISPAYVVRSLMPGAVALARETGAPLVPVSVWGSQRLWPQRRRLDLPFPRPDLTRGRLVDLRLHRPMRVAGDADIEATTRDLGQRLQAGLEELQRLEEHRPRPGEHAAWYPSHLGGNAPTHEECAEMNVMPRVAILPSWAP